jgi:hypothetical protein
MDGFFRGAVMPVRLEGQSKNESAIFENLANSGGEIENANERECYMYISKI